MYHLDHCFPLVVTFWSKTLLIQQILMRLPIPSLVLYAEDIKMSQTDRCPQRGDSFHTEVTRKRVVQTHNYNAIWQLMIQRMFVQNARESQKMEWLILWEGVWEDFRKKGIFKISFKGTSLAVQWLRLCLLTQGMWVQSLVGEVRSHMPHSQNTKT